MSPEDLVNDLVVNFAVPVLAAFVGLEWKRAATPPAGWSVEDRMLLSEFMVAAVFIELGYLVQPLWTWVGPATMGSKDSTELTFRGIVFVLLVGVLAASARLFRDYTEFGVLSAEWAYRFTCLGVVTLGLLLVFNSLLVPALAEGVEPTGPEVHGVTGGVS